MHRHAISVVRVNVLAGLLLAVVAASAGPALAHDDHGPLPDGLRATLVGVVDPAGESVALPATDFTISDDGLTMQLSHDDDVELIVSGIAAGEPLLRMADGRVEVNERSPSAMDVTGAQVDPGAAASLMDLLHERVEPRWLPVSTTTTVTWQEHRAAGGHLPDPGDVAAGEPAATFEVPILYGGRELLIRGEVLGDGAASGGRWPATFAGIAVVAGALTGLRARRLRQRVGAGGRSPQPVTPAGP